MNFPRIFGEAMIENGVFEECDQINIPGVIPEGDQNLLANDIYYWVKWKDIYLSISAKPYGNRSTNAYSKWYPLSRLGVDVTFQDPLFYIGLKHIFGPDRKSGFSLNGNFKSTSPLEKCYDRIGDQALSGFYVNNSTVYYNVLQSYNFISIGGLDRRCELIYDGDYILFSYSLGNYFKLDSNNTYQGYFRGESASEFGIEKYYILTPEEENPEGTEDPNANGENTEGTEDPNANGENPEGTENPNKEDNRVLVRIPNGYRTNILAISNFADFNPGKLIKGQAYDPKTWDLPDQKDYVYMFPLSISEPFFNNDSILESQPVALYDYVVDGFFIASIPGYRTTGKTDILHNVLNIDYEDYIIIGELLQRTDFKSYLLLKRE